MKSPSKTFALLMATMMTLTACGGDKPSDTPSPTTTTTTSSTTSTPSDTADTDHAVQDTTTAPSADTPSTDTPTDTDTDHTPSDTAKSDTAKDTAVQALSIEDGKKRYETTCKICHDQGLLDAPKLTDKANWAKRLEKGIDTLHTHSAKGFGKMPAQAVDDVSEAEVYAAVDYMVSQVK